MDGLDKRIDEWMDGLDGWMGRCIDRWIDGWMDIWIYIDGWMDVWVDGYR